MASNELPDELREQFASLKAEMEQYKTEMQLKVERYEAELKLLRQHIEQSGSPAINPKQVTNRRKMLKQMAAGVAGLGALSLGAAINSSAQAQVGNEETAIEAIAGTSGYGGKFGGGIAQLRLVPASVSGKPSPSGHKVGELLVDQNGMLYFATGPGGDTAGGWVKLGGSDTAGSLHLLPAAVRVAATIVSPAPTIVGAKLRAVGANPANPLASSTVALQMAGVGGIPVGARGVAGVLTNVSTTAGGNLRFWVGGAVPNTVNLNITGAVAPPPNLSVSFAIPLDNSGKVNLGYGTGIIGAECGYVVDITGYYL